jgi:hypothetical protein
MFWYRNTIAKPTAGEIKDVNTKIFKWELFHFQASIYLTLFRPIKRLFMFCISLTIQRNSLDFDTEAQTAF